MKQKLTFSAILLLALAIPQSVKAYDFSAVAPSGQTLYYSYHNGGCVWVTTPRGTDVQGHLRWEYYTKPTGSLIIPSNVTYQGYTYTVSGIDDYTFYEGSNLRIGLTSVVIPCTITHIGNYAFSGCGRITTPISIPDSVTFIGSYAFSGCSGLLGTLTLPESTTFIGNHAFSGCNLTGTLSIPNAVSQIREYSFGGCAGLTEIIIGSAVTSIENWAFAYDSGLTSVTCLSQEAPNLASFAFSGVPSIIPVTIPCGSSISYYPRWHYFSNFIETAGYGYSFSVESADSTKGRVVVDNQPTCQSPTALINAVPNTGYMFLHWSDGNTDNPRFLTLTQDTSIVAYFGFPTPAHDTVVIHDTVTIIDTILYQYYQYDTTIVHDTTIVNIFDTVINNYYQYDTTIVYDTIIINIYDTTIVNNYQYDTIIINNYYYDTIYINNYTHDTVNNYFYDTVNHYFYDTVIITHHYHDTVIVNNYIYDTIYLYRYLHDTVYIHDTVYLDPNGINDIQPLNAKIYQRNGHIIVEGAAGHTVTLYDAVGRPLATKETLPTGDPCELPAPTAGVYLVKIGPYPARRIVIIR